MANQYKTPGVYVEEISIFPPSVAAVETAIPAFIGYTDIAKEKVDNDLRLKPKKIGSFLEYRTFFGNAPVENSIVVNINTVTDGSQADDINASIAEADRSRHIMYYALQAFYDNGGGDCYIVSVGDYTIPTVNLPDLQAGLQEVRKEDEVTLIVYPESIYLSSIADFGSLMDASLAQCADLQDRFVIMDVYDQSENIDNDADAFRNNGVGIENLKYGAVYYPRLETVLDFYYGPENSRDNNVTVNLTIDGAAEQITLNDLKTRDNALYFAAISQINLIPNILPPSPIMAGIYARVDEARGVWKAPANVSVRSIIKPKIKISDKDQEDLNIDSNAGKSINAIRAFAGRGSLVWGARTLAGNDNEWRYISVRRFFNFAEESIKKATIQFVFEPNDANTWIKVRAMIENFLTLQWRAGALQGATTDAAFFVRVGLGQTMTALDILEGRMNVEIGMAVVRPAEFIILKFSHKMVES